MNYYVYLLITNYKNKIISYVGYTNNLKKRLRLHNTSKGAKYTRGRKWIVFHKEFYNSKSKAMSRESQIKKDRKFRNFLKEKFKKMSKDSQNNKNNLQ